MHTLQMEIEAEIHPCPIHKIRYITRITNFCIIRSHSNLQTVVWKCILLQKLALSQMAARMYNKIGAIQQHSLHNDRVDVCRQRGVLHTKQQETYNIQVWNSS